jgi:hypothetical protein
MIKVPPRLVRINRFLSGWCIIKVHLRLVYNKSSSQAGKDK